MLGRPLPEEEISSTVIGKFKLEHEVALGYFLAPKAYILYNREGKQILKYKGAAKDQIEPEWFEAQYADPFRKQQVRVESNFRIEWNKLQIMKKETLINIGLKRGSKRNPVSNDEEWIDTEPINIIDLGSLDHIGRKVIELLRKDISHLQTENLVLHEKLSQKEREISERYNKIKEELTEVSNPTLDKIPNTEDQTNRDEEIPNTNKKTDNQTNTDKKIPKTEVKKPP